MRRRVRRVPESLLWIGAVVVTAAIVGGLLLTRSSDPTPTSATERPEPDVIGIDDERISARTEKPLKVTFMGTSLAAGYFATSEAKSYVGRIAAALEEAGPVVPLRAPREEMAPGTPTTTDTFDPAKVEPGQGLFIIEVGTNDAAVKDEAKFERDYNRLLSGLAKRSPDALFMCAGLWQEQVFGYDAIIGRVCRQHGGRFVSMTEMFRNDAFHGPEGRDTPYGPGDVFHPNDDGHKAIAEALLASMADYTAPPGETY